MMLNEFHLIRPYWLFAILPLVGFTWRAFQTNLKTQAWSQVCDEHLLPYLIQKKPQFKRHFSLLLLMTSALFMVVSLSGPSWSRIPVPIYQPIQPRIFLLDMSDAMLIKDLLPDRLSRAKFILHDVLQGHEAGQFGLVVYSGEPFVASPLTDDSQTIDALLPMLTPDVMPVTGYQLTSALNEAEQLITQAGFNQGNILILTAKAPSSEDIATAKKLAQKNIHVSVMPVLNHEKAQNPLFKRLAKAGDGQLVPFSDQSNDLKQWLKASRTHHMFNEDAKNAIPVWQDQGRWFVLPALLFLLPVFRRGWIQRIVS